LEIGSFAFTASNQESLSWTCKHGDFCASDAGYY
jgi:hypothetical protein